MTATPDWPAAVAGLPVCPKRQLPIPYSTARWPDGTGRFAVNDVARKLRCGRERLCGICGTALGWWVVFLAEDHGPMLQTTFTDAPVHEECAEASLQLCPYIAKPRVPRRLDPEAAHPEGWTPDKDKAGWLMWVTRTYRMVPQPAAGGGTVWGFRPAPAVRIRRFAYQDGTLREL